MMSATPFLAETPAAPATTGPLPAAPAAGAPTDFQSLLAGAIPAAEPSLSDTLTPQSLAQLLTSRAPQSSRAACPAAGTPELALPDVEGDLSSLLADGSAIPAEIAATFPEETSERVHDEESASEDDIHEWLELMLPPMSTMRTSGGAAAGGEARPAEGAFHARGAALQPGAVLPSMLATQSEVPDAGVTLEPMFAREPVAVATSPLVLAGAMARTPGTPLLVANAVAEIANKESGTGEGGSADEWMSALGEPGARRTEAGVQVAMPRIVTPVQDPRWADAIAHRLVLMAREGETTASLRLTPQELGPLEIRISVRDDQASVHFGAAHQDTRNALELALPRLREMLEAQGLELANASVSQQSAGGGNAARPTPNTSSAGAQPDTVEVTETKIISTALLDTYA